MNSPTVRPGHSGPTKLKLNLSYFSITGGKGRWTNERLECNHCCDNSASRGGNFCCPMQIASVINMRSIFELYNGAWRITKHLHHSAKAKTRYKDVRLARALQSEHDDHIPCIVSTLSLCTTTIRSVSLQSIRSREKATILLPPIP